MLVHLAQLNPVVGDIGRNVELLRSVLEAHCDADLIVFPELFLTGCPPGTLLTDLDFLEQVETGLVKIRQLSQDYARVALLVGAPLWQDGRLFNAALVVQNGAVLGVRRKGQLTAFVGFDERQYFTPGRDVAPIKVKDFALGVTIGLELGPDLAEEFKRAGANLLINVVAAPFQAGLDPLLSVAAVAKAVQLPILRVGQVGGAEGLIFPGESCAFDTQGSVQELLPCFEVAERSLDLGSKGTGIGRSSPQAVAQIHDALVLGLRDYVGKNGLKQVIIGLSGGLDSAVSAALACAAVGSERVWGIAQPGPYSSPSSLDDARALAGNLGIRFDVLPVTDLYQAVLATLAGHFAETAANEAEENIQARLRAVLLMALSNKFGGLVLTNSNKSELAMGYCTLYGDMSGGLAVLGDLYKTTVYELADYLNRKREIIPLNTIKKPPSAELRPNQRDEQSLPPYHILDGILARHLDQKLTVAEIIAAGYDQDTVDWVLNTFRKNAHKRRQAAPILKVTSPIFLRSPERA